MVREHNVPIICSAYALFVRFSYKSRFPRTCLEVTIGYCDHYYDSLHLIMLKMYLGKLNWFSSMMSNCVRWQNPLSSFQYSLVDPGSHKNIFYS